MTRSNYYINTTGLQLTIFMQNFNIKRWQQNITEKENGAKKYRIIETLF